MREEQEPWARQNDEPLLWFRRFDRFRLMEPVPSIPDVYFEEHPASEGVKQRQKVPGGWYAIARQWHWEERATAWIAHLDELTEKRIAAEKKKVERHRYALQHKRIEKLDEIADQLIGYLEDEDNIWLPDVKAIGTGPLARQVDLIRFNSALFGEIREYLAGIAAEKGERIKKSKVDVTTLPKEYLNLPEDGSEE